MYTANSYGIRTLLLLLTVSASSFAQGSNEKAIDEAVASVMSATAVPSVSIVVARGNDCYVKAYGEAKLHPRVPATPQMRYKIASNSKHIAAAAVMVLVNEKKLSLDDKVARFLPTLTRANEVTIRMLLSHTSGYQDFYPLDYVAPFMRKEVTAKAILDKWGKMPLDFEPGTQWQYSNTNYVIIGQIIEKVSGMPLIEFLRAKFFRPLEMNSAVDITKETWSKDDPDGYTQFALGPPRPTDPEGNGWMYAAGELAMTASDLAKWDAALMRGKVLPQESLKILTQEVLLKDGSATGYALGLDIGKSAKGTRRWSHTGGAEGFISQNTMFPDEMISITVLTNGAGRACGAITEKIEEILYKSEPVPSGKSALDDAKTLFSALQHGQVDHKLVNSDLESYFGLQARDDFEASLGPLGAPSEFKEVYHEGRGGMIYRSYSVKTASKRLRISTYCTPDGKFAQFLVEAVPE
jgi:CubicO group peptidase (beta-lactamase class C family)